MATSSAEETQQWMQKSMRKLKRTRTHPTTNKLTKPANVVAVQYATPCVPTIQTMPRMSITIAVAERKKSRRLRQILVARWLLL